jgi:hypothetical protein
MKEIFLASERGEMSVVEEYLRDNGDIDLKDEVKLSLPFFLFLSFYLFDVKPYF